MNNSLAEVHPELVSEWSEKNLPLKPDEVNAKSRKMSGGDAVNAVTSGNLLSMPV